ncbi:T9SS type A sorting domain-containing protein [Reichenbachiella ulvae]|uniref:T9SS type A sorting domain-containing protein n=1 Tax=Reichenbachiella ulvae TaxID=2980104 RepID=A0ABT3CMU8_9BACT|nr:T9SS type A sorting domain-containing protein [Reichenbachiella ulvae]MCV9385025.1 T9SS type A sorting domain-containing protein [Reichenbachiella ulvae]
MSLFTQRNRLVSVVLFYTLFIFTTSTFAQLGGNQYLNTMRHSVNNGGTTEYYIYYPEDYDSHQNKPLLIALHGNAERGGNVSRMLGNDGEGSIAYLANQGQDFPFIVVSPHQKAWIGGTQYPSWNLEIIDQLIDHVVSELSIHPSNVFLTGYSSGGGDSYRYLLNYPNKIRATAVVAGLSNWTSTYGYNLINAPYPCQLKDHILRLWHGNQDSVVPYYQSANLISAINDCSPSAPVSPVLDLVNGYDHDPLRGYVYNNTTGANNIYEWLLQYQLATDDFDPPVTESINLNSIDQTSATVQVEFNELSYLFYGFSQDSLLTPSTENLLDGNQGMFDRVGTVNGLAPSISFGSLLPDQSYTLYFIARDNAATPNLQTEISSFTFTTPAPIPDTDAPFFTEQPNLTVSSTSLEVTFETDEPGYLRWALFLGQQTDLTYSELAHHPESILANEIQSEDGGFELAGLSEDKNYFLYLAATDFVGNSQHIVSEFPFSTLQSGTGLTPDKTININISNSNSVSVANWNNVNLKGFNNTITFSDLEDTNGENTPIDLHAFHKVNNSVINSVADNSSALNNGIYPNNVLRYAAYTSTTGMVQLQDLDVEHFYTITIHGGRSGSGSRPTNYNVNGQSQVLECVNNKTETVTFDKVSPNENGQIDITFTGTGTWGYLNALIMEEYVSLVSSDTTKPATPIFTGFENFQDKAEIFWSSTSLNKIKTFNLYSSENSISNSSQIEQIGIEDSSIIIIDRTKFYFISEVDQYGNESDLSESIKPTPADTIAPAQVQNFYATPYYPDSIVLNWDPVSDEDLMNYLIFRSTNLESLPSTAAFASTPNSNFTIDIQNSKTTWYYSIIAQDSSGNYSDFSEVISFTTPDIVAPSVPTAFISEIDIDKITIGWNSVPDPDLYSYKIYSSTIFEFSPSESTLIEILSANDTVSNINSLSSDSEYYFVVSALDSALNESFSTVLSARTLSIPDTIAPTPPSNISAIQDSLSVIVTWSKENLESDFSGFQLERSDSNENVNMSVFVTDTFFIDSSVQLYIPYTYRAYSVDSSANISTSTPAFNITLEDSFAPIYLQEPKVESVGKDEVTMTVQLNEPGEIIIQVLTAGSPTPSLSEVISNPTLIKNTDGSSEILIDNLSSGSNYDIYLAARDTVENLTDQLSLVSTSTLSSNQAYPLLTIKYNADGSYQLIPKINDSSVLYESPFVVGIGSSTLNGTGPNTEPEKLKNRIDNWLTNNTSNPKWSEMATGGWRSDMFLPDESGSSITRHHYNIDAVMSMRPDIVFISLPSNDQQNGVNSAPQFVENILSIIERANENGAYVFVQDTNPRDGFDLTARQRLIESAELLAQNIDSMLLVKTLEKLSITLSGDDRAKAKPEYASGDNIHLNGAGHEVIFDELIKKMTEFFTAENISTIELERSSISPTSGFAVIDSNLLLDGETQQRLDDQVYYYRARVKFDDDTYSTYSNTLSVEKPLDILETDQIIKVNLGPSHTNNSQWNNWNPSSPIAGETLILQDTVGNPAGVEIEIINDFYGAGTNGYSSGSSYPESVMEGNWQIRNSNLTPPVLSLKNLIPHATYNIQILSSVSTFQDNRRTGAWCQDQIEGVNSGNNNGSEVIEINGLIPDANNIIEIEFKAPWYGAGFINGIIIERKPSEEFIIPVDSVTNLIVTEITGSTLSFEWTSEASSFNVYKFPDYSTPYTTVDTPSFTDIGLFEKNTYQYRVSSINEIGIESDLSEEIIIQIPDITAPEAITNFSLTESGQGNIDLSWNNSISDDVYEYWIYQSTNNLDYSLIHTLYETNYSINNIPFDTSYFYVIAVDSASNKSNPSEVISYTNTSTSGPIVLSKVQINMSNSNSLSVPNWNNANLSGISGSRAFNNLLDTAGNTTSMTFIAYNGNGSIINNVASNGSSLNGGIYPNQVIQYAAYSSGTGIVELSNLDNDHEYTIHLLAGRSGTGSRITRFTINNNETQDVESVNNNSEIVIFEKVTPINGSIEIQFQELPQWAYLNALVVIEYAPSDNGARTNQSQITNLIDESDIQIYPVPFAEYLKIDMKQNVDWAKIKLYDLAGKTIYEAIKSGKDIDLDMSDVGSGTYILHINSISEVYVRQIIKR